MRGQNILITPNATGRFIEGYIGAGLNPFPGQILQIDPTVSVKGGCWTFKLFSRVADGDRPAGPLVVLLPDKYQGRTAQSQYSAGERLFGYIPRQGDEFNLLLADVAGTGDIHTAGDLLMVQNNTGKLITTSGTPQSTPFMLLESLAALTADTLAWVIYS